MSIFLRGAMGGIFLSAALSNSAVSQDSTATLEYAAIRPTVVLHDSYTNTDMVFIESHIDDEQTIHEKLARYDHAMGVSCQWDKATHDNHVTLSNPQCVAADSLADEWTTAPMGSFGKYIRLLGEAPRYSRFTDDWIVEVFAAVNPVNHNVIKTKRIWDLEKSLVCLSIEEGFQEPGNEYAYLDFGCHPIVNTDYVNSLVERIALQP